MKYNAKIILAAAAVVSVLACPAHATIVLGPSTVSWPASGGGPNLDVTYYVDLTGSTYSYFYVVTPPADNSITSFTVDVFQQATLGNVASLAPASSYTGDSISAGVSVTWNFNDLTGPATNSFTSQYSPVVFGIGDATTKGVSGSWTSPVPDIPIPVPEASSMLAGFTMLLPLGFGAFRALRKIRAAEVSK